MTDAVIHLFAQPESWPRWRQAGDNSAQHLFVFVARTEKHGTLFGQVRPACWWTDGAERVEYLDRLPWDDNTDADHCPTCLEAELQHGLREFGTM